MNDKELTAEDRQRIIDSLIAGRKIEAIKHYRHVTGTGLKEAKEFIDMLVKELSKEHQELIKAGGSGCSTAALVLLSIGLSAYYLL